MRSIQGCRLTLSASITHTVAPHAQVGPNDNRFGPRFPAINGVYDKTFQKVVETVAAEHSMTDRLHTGAVYGSVSGKRVPRPPASFPLADTRF